MLLAQEVRGEIVGPFTDITRQLVDIVWDYWPGVYKPRGLVVILSIGVLLFLIRKGRGAKGADGRERKTGLLNYLVPKDIYTHKSARVDLSLWVFERMLRPLWAVSLIATVAPATERFVIGSMQTLFGATPALQPTYAWMVVYTAALLLSYDLAFYAIHWSMHRFPALWAIHKVHHSAEVLTPLTRAREHFLSGPIWATGSGFGYAIPGGIFAYLFDGGITRATILGVVSFSVLYGFNGSFRHYHVQFRYPDWLSKWIQSPAMHHIHHSYLEKHWGKNMAATTSIWDRLFGTLYIPEEDEYTPWGLGPETQAEYRGFWQNTTGPFRDWYRMLQGRRDAPQLKATAPQQPPEYRQ